MLGVLKKKELSFVKHVHTMTKKNHFHIHEHDPAAFSPLLSSLVPPVFTLTVLLLNLRRPDQRALWCVQLERLYHQRVLDNLSALQQQWGNTVTHHVHSPLYRVYWACGSSHLVLYS